MGNKDNKIATFTVKNSSTAERQNDMKKRKKISCVQYLNLKITVVQLCQNQNQLPIPEIQAMHLVDLQVLGMQEPLS